MGRMPSHFDPALACRYQNGPVELNHKDSCTARGCQSLDSQSVVDPAKVLRPILATRMKQSGQLTREWINRSRATGFSLVACATAQTQILSHRQATERLGNDVINLERHPDNRGSRLAIRTSTFLVFRDENTQRPGNASATHD